MPESDLAAHFNLFLLRNFLDADSCASLKVELAIAPTTQAPVYIEGTPGKVHEQLMRQKSALEAHFGTSLTDCERPQFLRYEKGDFFVRHQDGNTHQLDFDHLRVRRISIVVFLNDSSVESRENCFSGGALTFYDSTTTFSLMGETGLLVAFTSDTFHEVLPVTSGERFTVISWFR